jgi:DNA repair protein RadA/Sms
MARAKVQFQCTECGGTAPKWTGQCADCGAWNTLIESVVPGRAAGRGGRTTPGAEPSAVADVSELPAGETPRASTGLEELDHAIGGGLVPGSVILLGGDPGIGKSTLLLQVLAAIGARGGRVLYVSAEESADQIGGRAQRLELPTHGLRVLAENGLQRILELTGAERPQVLVVDSIQTVYTDALESAPGSVSQVRECAAQLVRLAKSTGMTVLLVGHVTKEGALAGPRVLEHMVDTVLYFEGDTGSRFRVIRAVKNRYGAVNELGVFAMTDAGLRQVSNPSAIFISRAEERSAGSVVMVTREGTRPLLVEVQALVDDTHGQLPRRVCVGLEQNRLAMLLAVLHRHAGVVTWNQDIFINVVGGVRIGETAADLPVLLAVVSSQRDRVLPRELVVFGEVGLSGEIRPVQNGPERLKEAAKHGFRRAVVPRANAPRAAPEGMEIVAVQRLGEALERM